MCEHTCQPDATTDRHTTLVHFNLRHSTASDGSQVLSDVPEGWAHRLSPPRQGLEIQAHRTSQPGADTAGLKPVFSPIRRLLDEWEEKKGGLCVAPGAPHGQTCRRANPDPPPTGSPLQSLASPPQKRFSSRGGSKFSETNLGLQSCFCFSATHIKKNLKTPT